LYVAHERAGAGGTRRRREGLGERTGATPCVDRLAGRAAVAAGAVVYAAAAIVFRAVTMPDLRVLAGRAS
jgi:hypothetical protein